MLTSATICTLLAARWEQLSPEERHHAVMVARIPAIRVERIISDPLVTAAASAQELIAIGCAVGIDLLDLHRATPRPELAPGQSQALAAAPTEFGWSHEETLRLHDAARVEMGRGGVRRLPLASIKDWPECHGRDERWATRGDHPGSLRHRSRALGPAVGAGGRPGRRGDTVGLDGGGRSA